MTDRHTDSEEILKESIALYEELEVEGPDRTVLRGYASALNNLSYALDIQDKDPERRVELLRQALEIDRLNDDPAGMAVRLGNLGFAAAEAGDFDEARRLVGEAIKTSRVLHSAVNMMNPYWMLGLIELAAGAPDEARVAFERMLAHAVKAELFDRAALGRAYLDVCDADLGDTRAVERFGSHTAEAFTNPDLRAMAKFRQQFLVLRSCVDAATGDFKRAAKVLGASKTMEETGKTVVSTLLRGRRDRVLEEVRSNLGDAAAAKAIDSGRQLDDEAVIELITG